MDEHLGGGMPLVLKDGRIANVTVHSIPFATGAEILDPAAQAAMAETFRPLATDCFLTAQAIGHVAPGAARDGDTLAAHRLARARAEGVQTLLAGLGMPQPAVASVWDWQFLVQESRVTLWVFSLTVGDDCDGEPLPIEAPGLAGLTGATPGEVPAEMPEEPSVASRVATEAAADPMPGSIDEAADALGEGAPRELQVTADGAGPISPDAVMALPETAPNERSPVAADATPDTATPDTTTPDTAATGELSRPVGLDPLATAAVGPADNTRRPAATIATAPAAELTVDSAADSAADSTGTSLATDVAALDAAAPLAEVEAAVPPVVITFDVNSSFFPAGAGRQLRAFLTSLPEAAPVELALEVAVGTGDVRGASGEEAKRYNAWMAERRVQRVAEWLAANAGDRPITVSEQLVENDPSREVRLLATVSR